MEQWRVGKQPPHAARQLALAGIKVDAGVEQDRADPGRNDIVGDEIQPVASM
jgi:hypothetical protein